MTDSRNQETSLLLSSLVRDFRSLPRTFFYDWVYVNALYQNPELSERIEDYAAFSDIEFNRQSSINCQAYSAALYVSLSINRCLDDALLSPRSFFKDN